MIWGVLVVLAVVLSLACTLVVRRGARKLRIGLDQTVGVQKYHVRPVPRVGGVGIYVALLVLGAVAPVGGADRFDLLTMLGVGSIVFFVGLGEDLTRRVGAGWRYAAALTSALLAVFALSARLMSLDVPGIDSMLQSAMWVSAAFTIFAVAGVAHSMNLVDGANGLASVIAAIAFFCVGLVAREVGDAGLAYAGFVGCGAALGFLALNYPRGHIFLGDAGAYLLGFLLAEISVLLVVRYPQVSPWFPLLVLIYPIWETLFTMFRRIVVARTPFMEPDNLHLHQILYRCLLAAHGPAPRARDRVRSNAGASARLWPLAIVPGAVAVAFYHSTPILMFASLCFVVCYGFIYRLLAEGERGQPALVRSPSQAAAWEALVARSEIGIGKPVRPLAMDATPARRRARGDSTAMAPGLSSEERDPPSH